MNILGPRPGLECAGTSYTHSGVPNSVSVSDNAHRFWLLLASVTHPNTRTNHLAKAHPRRRGAMDSITSSQNCMALGSNAS